MPCLSHHRGYTVSRVSQAQTEQCPQGCCSFVLQHPITPKVLCSKEQDGALTSTGHAKQSLDLKATPTAPTWRRP